MDDGGLLIKLLEILPKEMQIILVVLILLSAPYIAIFIILLRTIKNKDDINDKIVTIRNTNDPTATTVMKLEHARSISSIDATLKSHIENTKSNIERIDSRIDRIEDKRK